MRIMRWIRAEIKDWLEIDTNERIGFTEDGTLTFAAPHPDKVEGRAALKALTKSPWTIALGAALFGAVVAKLF